MPSNSGRNTLSRQWELLQLLPTSESGATARALQERLAEAGFPTTKRTVERDLEDLHSRSLGERWAFAHAARNTAERNHGNDVLRGRRLDTSERRR